MAKSFWDGAAAKASLNRATKCNSSDPKGGDLSTSSVNPE